MKRVVAAGFLCSMLSVLWQGIPTVTVVERNAAGTIVDRVVVNIVGTSTGFPGPMVPAGGSC